MTNERKAKTQGATRSSSSTEGLHGAELRAHNQRRARRGLRGKGDAVPQASRAKATADHFSAALQASLIDDNEKCGDALVKALRALAKDAVLAAWEDAGLVFDTPTSLRVAGEIAAELVPE